MGPEHEPNLTDKNDTDPSINPTNLIVQGGLDDGRIEKAETTPGETREVYNERLTKYLEDEPIRAHSHEMTAGLPVIGAEAEKAVREDPEHAANTSMLTKEERESQYDEAGTEAMAAEVKNRAIELVKKQFPLASQELIDQFAQKASDKFKAELESKNAEKKAEHDKGVQAMIDSLDSPDSPFKALSEDLFRERHEEDPTDVPEELKKVVDDYINS